MRGMMIASFCIVAIKFLMAIPLLLFGVAFGLLGFEIIGFDYNRVMGLSVFLGAIGLGYPFALGPIQRTLKWILIALASLPFCFAMAFFPTADLGSWVWRTIALFWVVLALLDLLLSERVAASPGARRRGVIVAAVVAIAGAVTLSAAVDFSPKIESYEAPAT
jgi:hypothetical protein